MRKERGKLERVYTAQNYTFYVAAASVIYNMAYDRRFFNEETGAYFYSVNEKSLVSRDNPANVINHIVVIVGWGDDWPNLNLADTSGCHTNNSSGTAQFLPLNLPTAA
ncbi:MAG: hypothetical protein IJM47_00175 [Synergistaceae bacterium]|nr:hypothetical protein [Synergistaceae bacterium]